MTQSYDRYPYYEEGLEEYDFPREIRTRSIQEIIEQRQQDRGIDPDWPHVKSTVEKIANDDGNKPETQAHRRGRERYRNSQKGRRARKRHLRSITGLRGKERYFGTKADKLEFIEVVQNGRYSYDPAYRLAKAIYPEWSDENILDYFVQHPSKTDSPDNLDRISLEY